MLGYTMSAANCLLGNMSSFEAKRDSESKLLSSCIRVDSVSGSVERPSLMIAILYRVKYQYAKWNMKVQQI